MVDGDDTIGVEKTSEAKVLQTFHKHNKYNLHLGRSRKMLMGFTYPLWALQVGAQGSFLKCWSVSVYKQGKLYFQWH